jgi:hypothetical protein
VSVTFRPAGEDRRPLVRCACEELVDSCEGCRTALNLSNANAADLIRHVGLPYNDYLIGQIRAPELVTLCEARLARLEVEPAIATVQLTERASIGGRRSGYLREKTAALLAMARVAGKAWVSWD